MKYANLLLEYNVINSDEITQYLEPLVQDIREERIRTWLLNAARKHILNTRELLEPVTELPPDAPEWSKSATDLMQFDKYAADELTNKINHIKDWLRALQEDARNTNNPNKAVLAKRTLQKMPKLSLSDAIVKADEWTLTLGRASRRIRKSAEGKRQKVEATAEHPLLPGENIVMKFKDGYFVVQMTTQDALTREGNIMSHCIGSYGSQMKSGTSALYSLRDPNGYPHASIEIRPENNSVVQIQGKQDSVVVNKYHPYLKAFIINSGFNLPSDQMRRYSWFKAGDKIFTLDEVLKNPNMIPSEIKGDFDISGFKISKLPDKLHVMGNFKATGSSLQELPNELVVDGDLDISETRIKSLSKKLKVGGIIDVSKTQIQLPSVIPGGLKSLGAENLSFGDSLEVVGTLHLQGVKQLPNELRVHKDLIILKSRQLKELPKKLYVGGSMDIRLSRVDKLTQKVFNGDLDISGTDISELPNGLTVKGNFDMSDTRGIKQLPKEFYFGGNVTMTDCDMEVLPDGFTVNGNLNIAGLQKMKTLPKGLVVTGILEISMAEDKNGVKVKIPKDAKYGKLLDITDESTLGDWGLDIFKNDEND